MMIVLYAIGFIIALISFGCFDYITYGFLDEKECIKSLFLALVWPLTLLLLLPILIYMLGAYIAGYHK